MNISQNQINDGHHILTVSINKSDYQDKVKQTLKDFQKKANIPGFRKGQIPMGMIKKQYENGIIYEEINKLISENLNEYLKTENLTIMAEPLPIMKEDFDIQADPVEFQFEIGIQPKINIDLSSISLPYYHIGIEDSDIDKTIKHWQKQFGTPEDKDIISDNSTITIKLEELKDGDDKIVTQTPIDLEAVKDKAKWIGKKKGETFTINVQDIYNNPHLLEHVLNISHAESHTINSDFKVTIEDIKDVVLADVNQDLFNKLYGEGKINSEKELRTKVREESQVHFEKEANTQFVNEAIEYLVKNTPITLPKDFLVKFIKETSKTPITEEEALKQYESQEPYIKYQLIESALFNANDLKIEYQDLIDYKKDQLREIFKNYGLAEIPEEELTQFATDSFKEEKEIKKTLEEVQNHRLNTYLLAHINKDTRNITIEDFYKLADEKHHNKG